MKTALCLAALALAAQANAAELGVLAPVLQDKAPLMRAAPGGTGEAPVVSRVTSGSLYDALQKEASNGFTARMLALDDAAMRIAGKGKTTWLYMSLEDGGFPRQGFWLKEGDNQRWIDEPYVDLVVDADSVADGAFEEIFAHELGHVFLRRLCPTLPGGYSRTPHHSFSITDQETAFDEGWATHFQATARRFTSNERLRAQDMGAEYKAFIPLWMHNSDRNARVDGVRQNWFVHRQVALPGAGDAVERLELSTMFDRARLKTAAQILASEGAVATFFYRQFAPASADTLVARHEPVFKALKEFSHTQPPYITSLARTLSAQSPEDGRRFVQVLVETSYGALASPKLAAQSEAVARAGRFGDAEAFVPALKQGRAAMAAEVAGMQAHPEHLAAHAGPGLWLLASKDARTVNLNTAEKEHLLALPGINAAAAERALASRARDGDFRSVADFAHRAGLRAAPFEAMAAAARKAGTFPRS